MHINPKTSELAADLAIKICDAIDSDAEIYTRPENAAVLPEALLSVLASTIATQYKRQGHAELIRLSTEKLTRLVEDAYALRQFFDAAAAAGEDVSDPAPKARRAAQLADELLAVAEADALVTNLPPDLEAELEKLMANFFRAGPAKH